MLVIALWLGVMAGVIALGIWLYNALTGSGDPTIDAEIVEIIDDFDALTEKLDSSAGRLRGLKNSCDIEEIRAEVADVRSYAEEMLEIVTTAVRLDAEVGDDYEPEDDTLLDRLEASGAAFNESAEETSDLWEEIAKECELPARELLLYD